MHSKSSGGGWPSTRVLMLGRMTTSGDNQAWSEFAELYVPIVIRFCRQRGLQDADAEEVAQNVFMNVVQAMPDFQYDVRRGRFRSWLCTIACREILRYREKVQRQVKATGGEYTDALCDVTHREVEAAWCETFYAGIYEAARQRVRPRFDTETWRAFILTSEERVPAAEVGQLLGKNMNWVYKAKFRVQKTLQAVVVELGADAPALNM